MYKIELKAQHSWKTAMNDFYYVRHTKLQKLKYLQYETQNVRHRLDLCVGCFDEYKMFIDILFSTCK